MFRRCFILICVALVVSAVAARAADYELDVAFFDRDPDGEIRVWETDFAPTSGLEAGYVVWDNVSVGKQPLNIRYETTIVATDAGGGAIKVALNLEKCTRIGEFAVSQETTTQVKKSCTVQPGTKIRLELGDDPKNKVWVEVTVRKAK